MRLSPSALRRLPADVSVFDYDRLGQAVGIVHLGIGAFHRTHQAVYTDDALNAGDRNWKIVGVSMRSADVADKLNPQGGLYSLCEKPNPDEAIRVIGAVERVFVADRDGTQIAAAIALPSVHVVSLTVTEKGYGLVAERTKDTPGHGSVGPADSAAPRSLYGYLEAGLRRRRAQGLGGVTLLSCDNLAQNGVVLGRRLADHLEARDPDLARWVEAACTSPCTMVDRMAPAPTPLDLERASQRLGVEDHAAVVAEPFRQWVIEDRFAGPRPRWEVGGAQFVTDVAPFETAKLRMLNGAHSAMAYLGLARGHTFVHEAVGDASLRPLIEQILRDSAASLDTSSPLDTDAYAKVLLARFDNAALPYRLGQIAMDGSQKIPPRWLETLSILQARGQSSPALLTAVAAWISYLRKIKPSDDPMASVLSALWKSEGLNGVAEALFGQQGLFHGAWVASGLDLQVIKANLANEIR